MKQIILLLIMIISLSFTTTPTNIINYCDGWTAGYKAGYCYEVNPCLEPIVPSCPLARVNETTYQDGYNRGFVKGKSDK